MSFRFEPELEPSYLFSDVANGVGAEFIFSTRLNGTSPIPFDSLNMAFTTADTVSNIINNRRLFFKRFNIDLSKVVYMQQTHGINIQIADKSDAGRGAKEYLSGFPDTDGILTNDPEIVVCGCFADCVPVWIYDPIRKAGGIIHAGWKGTAQSIVKHGIKKLSEWFGTETKDIIAGIGPSIGPCCFKVDQITAQDITFSIANHQRNRVTSDESGEDVNLDLWLINSLQLQDAGVLTQNIITAGQCTCCMQDIYHSFRRDKEMSGRMSAIFRILR